MHHKPRVVLVVDPLMLDVPEELKTPRLTLRAPRIGDGAVIFPTVKASHPELKRWMVWATDDYDQNAAEQWCRRSAAKFIERQQFAFLMFFENGEHVGNVNLFNFNWDVPRCEIGYWLATRHCGRGLMCEAVGALFTLAVATLKVQRVEIRCDDLNARSARVAELCGFTLEGVLRRESRGADGMLRDLRVYAKFPAQACV